MKEAEKSKPVSFDSFEDWAEFQRGLRHQQPRQNLSSLDWKVSTRKIKDK